MLKSYVGIFKMFILVRWIIANRPPVCPAITEADLLPITWLCHVKNFNFIPIKRER